MTCDSCVTTVGLALSKVKGVASAEVSLEKKQAKVAYDPMLVMPEQLKATVEAAGFKATETTLISSQ